MKTNLISIISLLFVLWFALLPADAQTIAKWQGPSVNPKPTGYIDHGFSANPFGWCACTSVEIPDSAAVSMRVFAYDSVLIFRSHLSVVSPGEYGISWRGADSLGTVMPAGLYWLEVTVRSINTPRRNLEAIFSAKGLVYWGGR